MKTGRFLQLAEGYRLLGVADDPADRGFTVGQLYAIGLIKAVSSTA